jgi:hypothetical protein
MIVCYWMRGGDIVDFSVWQMAVIDGLDASLDNTPRPTLEQAYGRKEVKD